MALAGRPWTSDEVATLVREWPAHGGRWDGWAEVLPDRTEGAICRRANQLHLHCGTDEVREGDWATCDHDRVVLDAAALRRLERAWDAGVPIAALSERFGLSRAAVTATVRRIKAVGVDGA